jgi:hypothetical protein
MVHVYCLNDNCRRAIHLISEEFWDFKGRIKCVKCGLLMELEIKDGELISAIKAKQD